MPTSGWWADETASSSDDSENGAAKPAVLTPKNEWTKPGKDPCKFYYGSMYGNVVHAISGRTLPEKASSKESLKYYCVVMNEGCALGQGNTMKDAVRCYFYNPAEYENATGEKLSAAQTLKWRAKNTLG